MQPSYLPMVDDDEDIKFMWPGSRPYESDEVHFSVTFDWCLSFYWQRSASCLQERYQ